ncbi:DUF805 domain-containing protein [soil metagenome]
MEYFMAAIKQYAIFTGRASRKDYWMFVLFYFIFYVGAAIVDKVLGTFLFTTILSLGLLVPSIAVATRRLHDTGRSGWWQLIAFLPIVGIIILIVFLAQEGHGENEFGAKPQAVV